MSAPQRTVDSAEVSVAATGVIAEFAAAGVLSPADVQVSRTLCRLGGEQRPRVQLAVALTVRALRLGSVCLDLAGVRTQVIDALLDPALLEHPAHYEPGTSAPAGVGATGPRQDATGSDGTGSDGTGSPVSAVSGPNSDELQARRSQLEALEWPAPHDWLAEVSSSGLVGDTVHQPLRVWQGKVYLTRYATAEEGVIELLSARVDTPPPQVDEVTLERTLTALFPDPGDDGPDPQSEAARTAVRSWTTVLAGGPGTGKTTTVAAMLAAIAAQHPYPLRVALAAPTGRAARRLGGAVAERASSLGPLQMPKIPAATTLHRLLGSRGAGRGFSAGPNQLLTYDVIVVDEMSMVALPMLHRLLAATPATTRLILVGDPHQLAPVEAGQVMADVAALALPQAPGSTDSSVVTLTHNYRNSGVIDEVAEAIRRNDPDRAVDLLGSGDPALELVEVDDPYVDLSEIPAMLDTVVAAGVDMVRAARAGDAAAALAALDSQRVMCAHRRGPYGVARWSALIRDAVHARLPGFNDQGDFYPGRPVLASHNDPDLGVNNGDSGVVVADSGGAVVALGGQHEQRRVAGWLLPGLTTLWAMTIHKAQGSQYPQVSVVLPPVGSPLLTRELLYTALTRAQNQVRLIGSIEAVRTAITTPTRRSSGLAARWEQRPTRLADHRRPDAADPAPF